MNKKTQLKKLLSFILCIALIAAVALFTIGCSDNEKNEGNGTGAEEKETLETTADDAVKELGEGDTSFSFVVADLEGNEVKFTVKTNKKIVGEALQEVGLVEGEDGPYGLYIKKVYGIVADYDVDQTYWAFYVNGEYAVTGVDKTEINPADVYMLKVSK